MNVQDRYSPYRRINPIILQLKPTGTATDVRRDQHHSIVFTFSFFISLYIHQSKRQVVMKPAVHHGTNLLMDCFSIVIAPLFWWFWDPPTKNHRVQRYRCWFATNPEPADSQFSCYHLGSPIWLAETCCGHVVRHKPHIAAGKWTCHESNL